MNTFLRRTLIVLGILAALAVAAVLGVSRWVSDATPELTEEEIRERLFTTIERESAAAFLVTGRLQLTATTRVENTKVLLPGLVGLNLGTTSATVRVPGRASYGFEVDSLKPEMVRMLEDGTIEIRIPPLAVYSTEADLSRLEVETTRGWARVGTRREEVERRALTIVEGAMRTQALNHLRTSYQPRINASRALERLLRPALQGLGMEDPQFRFRVDDELVVLPTG